MTDQLNRLARAYGVTTRTLRRWHAEGIDIQDHIAIAEKLLAPSSVSAIEPMIEILSNQDITNEH